YSIVNVIGLRYKIGVQLKEDEIGIPKIIEISPGFEVRIILCFAAGINLPYLAVKQALNEPLLQIDPKWETKIIRHWD
ncbi:MAG: ATP-grasp domain-containing protein, partial [Candidatus Aenigmarchaeota archaeon]|nr:ATP-grasp domain-containing protein [Candidatus Aenigmarchaeota archaeon]